MLLINISLFLALDIEEYEKNIPKGKLDNKSKTISANLLVHIILRLSKTMS